MTIKNYINGKWINAKSKEKVAIINPATEEVLGYTPLGTKKDVDDAVDAGHKAFRAWRDLPAVDRIQYFFKMKEKLEERFQHLSETITREHGKTLSESRGSVRRAIQMVETACSIPSLMMGQNFENIARSVDCATVRRPMGVFAGIAPFNFPAMVPFWFWPFAVACGNTYVLKASERVPLTAVEVFKIIDEIGFPPGVVNLVHGAKEVVDSLCTHPLVKGVSFVGSTPVARHVYQTASFHGKRVQALGGAKNLMVVLPDALTTGLRKTTVQTAIDSITGCAGERCLAGSLVLCVGDDTYENFKHLALEQVTKIRVGNGLDPQCDMGPLISNEAKSRVSAMIAKAVKDGAKLLLDGRIDCPELGYYLKPSILADIQAHWDIAKEEVFGPVVLISKVKTIDDAISWINSIPLANTTTLFTSSGAMARKFAYEVDPSMIGINIGVPAPMSFFSFGGSKDSFFGDIKVHGKASVEFFTDCYTTIYRWHQEGNIWES